MTDKWTQPTNPPPPLFLGSKERDLTKQVNDELLERVLGQTILYYGISMEETLFNMYGEAINKTFYPPVRVMALVFWEEMRDSAEPYDDKISKIRVNFHKRRLNEDQKLAVRIGDYVLYGERYYEIKSTEEPRNLFGQVDRRFEIGAICQSVREGVFNGE